MSAIALLVLLVPCIAEYDRHNTIMGDRYSTVTSWTFSRSCGCAHISETLGPVSCPSTGRDECKAYYNISYDWPTDKAFEFEEEFEQLPYISITDHPGRPYDNNSTLPPLNVTIRAAIIDGIEGTVTNVSRFSNVDDAINAQIILDPAWANNTADQALTREVWLEYGSLDGEWEWMLATYNLSDRGNGASGIVEIYGNADVKSVAFPWYMGTDNWKKFKMTPDQLMHVINTIHVTESRHYAKYIGEETVEIRTNPIYKTTYSGPL